MTTTLIGRPLPDAQCPRCAALTVRFSLGAGHVGCGTCGWALALEPAHVRDLVDHLAHIKPLKLSEYLQILAAASSRVDPAPAPLYLVHLQDGTSKHVSPLKSPPSNGVELLNHKADVAESNDVSLSPGDRCIVATSQRHFPGGSVPAHYHLQQIANGVWGCDCAALHLCAHLAAYWRHCTAQYATQPTRALRLTIRAIEHQADAEVLTRWGGARPGSRQAAARDAAEALFG